jgi:hypothetical protein
VPSTCQCRGTTIPQMVLVFPLSVACLPASSGGFLVPCLFWWPWGAVWPRGRWPVWTRHGPWGSMLTPMQLAMTVQALPSTPAGRSTLPLEEK